MRTSPYRKIPTSVWSLGLTATERDVYFWIASGPLTSSVPGLVRAGPDAIAAELKRPPADVREALRGLEQRGLVRYDEQALLVWRVDAFDDNLPANSKVVKGWRAAWAALPRCPLLLEAAETLAGKLPSDRASAFLEFAYVGFPNRTANGIGNGSGNGSRYQGVDFREPQESGYRIQEEEREQRSAPAREPLQLVAIPEAIPSSKTTKERRRDAKAAAEARTAKTCPIVEAWNRGADDRHQEPASGPQTRFRDDAIAKLLAIYPDPAEWEGCARALSLDHYWAPKLQLADLTRKTGGQHLERFMREGKRGAKSQAPAAWEGRELL